MPTPRCASALSQIQALVSRREGENVHQNNLNRTRSGYREVKLLMEMKAVGHPLRGASDLSQRQALVSTDKIIYNGEKAETGPSIY